MPDWSDKPPPAARPTIEAWIKRLDAGAALNAMRVNPVPGRRAIEPWLLAWRERRRSASLAGHEAPISTPASPPESHQPDVRLWRALVLDEPVPTEIIDIPPADAIAPILDPHAGMTLEVWTETELCALHALWRLAARHTRPDWRRRCIAAALWHTDNLQPDNATNVPWGTHVFVVASAVLAAAADERAAALSLHAETLLHNAVVLVTRPDALSSQVLADAADALREEL